MKIRLLAVGRRMPEWVERGFETYQRRLPPHLNLTLTEIPPGPRGNRGNVPRAVAAEAQALVRAADGAVLKVALDERGKPWSTRDLAAQLERWQSAGGDVALWVGGPDGLDPTLRDQAHARWSLGPLTLPHPLVRVILAEQIYRAWTLLTGHPYHRD